MKSVIVRAVVGAAALALSATLLAPVGTAEATPRSYPGMSAYPTYNANFYSGPTVYNQSQYVSQGLAAWPGRNSMIISSYDKRGGYYDSLLSVVGRLGGGQQKVLRIGEGHVGGLATGNGYLWMVNTNPKGESKLRRYKLSRIDAAKSGSYLGADAIFDVRASSFVAWRDGDVWVGNFTTEFGQLGTLWRYNVSGGSVSKNPIGSMRTPGRTQGVAFSGNYVIWSQSYGRTNASRIRISTISGSKTTYINAPTMSQDLAIADGFVYVVYESGAYLYRYGQDGKGRSTNPISELHYASVRTLLGRL